MDGIASTAHLAHRLEVQAGALREGHSFPVLSLKLNVCNFSKKRVFKIRIAVPKRPLEPILKLMSGFVKVSYSGQIFSIENLNRRRKNTGYADRRQR
jgi:hypothetical protein